MTKKMVIIFLIVGFASCKSPIDYYNIPTFNNSGNLQAVIEIPAGTNFKYEFQKRENSFLVDIRENKKRKIDFLPYPANYGYIPSTFSNPIEGGDGDALDVLVLSETVKTGSILEITPIAMLKLKDDEALDYKIIAVPVAQNNKIVGAENYRELSANYPGIKEILELWFTNYDREEKTEILGWKDEKEAILEIKKWQTH